MNPIAACFGLFLLTWMPSCIHAAAAKQQRLMVEMTLVKDAAALGAFCLDGSLPAYHIHRGFGDGARNWLLQFEGGGWCNDIPSCLDRAKSRRGSTNLMVKWEIFSGILGNNASQNPGYFLNPQFQYGGKLSDHREVMEGVQKVIQRLEPNIDKQIQVINQIMMFRDKEHSFGTVLAQKAVTRTNPDFYNWNRVKIRYCDGASFAGDSTYLNGKSLLYFRGARIWKAVINDLLPKGLANAEKALLSGCSAGGLASFLHCDNFTQHLPKTATVKCLSDAGFFMDGRDINSNYPMRSFYSKLVSLQGVEKNLDKNCTCSLADPKQCIFPQYLLPFIKTPFFILNAAYDVYQFHHTLVPPSADTGGHWVRCKSNPAACNANQTNFLQEYRDDMIAALAPFEKSTTGGLFINSCFAHCQSESQDTWFAPDSPTINDQSIAKTVGDWFFERKAAKEIDCPYPCDKTCHNLLPETTD